MELMAPNGIVDLVGHHANYLSISLFSEASSSCTQLFYHDKRPLKTSIHKKGALQFVGFDAIDGNGLGTAVLQGGEI